MKGFIAQIELYAELPAGVNTGQKEKTGKGGETGLYQNKPVVRIHARYYQHYNRHTKDGMYNQGFVGDLSECYSHTLKIALVFANKVVKCWTRGNPLQTGKTG
jgi:hypothetical protein